MGKTWATAVLICAPLCAENAAVLPFANASRAISSPAAGSSGPNLEWIGESIAEPFEVLELRSW